MRLFTHVGTVVYKGGEDEAFVHLNGTTAIREKLDVRGDAFDELLGNPNDCK